MPKKEKKPKRRGAPPKYDWKRLLGKVGTLSLLQRGVDFDCEPHSMMIMLRSQASKRGLLVSVHVKGSAVSVVNKGKKRSKPNA